MVDLTVVVRAAGERTEAACLEFLRKQASGCHVEVVHERPFSKALEKSIERAISFGTKWTLLADADVLFRQGALGEIVAALENAPEPCYMVNFRVLDRGFGGPAYAGVHGYRTSLLPKALRFMDAARQDQRPETRLYKEMARLGHPTLLSGTVTGLHDYEQFHRDLYRKMFVRAFKYGTQMGYMFERFRSAYKECDEAKVMLWGLMEGAQERTRRSQVELDVSFYERKSAAVLDMLGIAEKHPIENGAALSPDDALRAFVPDDLYRENEAWIAPQPGTAGGARAARDSLSQRVKARFSSALSGGKALRQT